MAIHSHDIGSASWPFEDSENTACYSCSHVLDEGHPVLRVAHDEDDGAWQFLCGQLHELEQGRIVCLGCMIAGDRQLMVLADLPLGWGADREQASSSWVRERNRPASDDDEDGG